jgi:hypothetical protein
MKGKYIERRFLHAPQKLQNRNENEKKKNEIMQKSFSFFISG